MTRAWSVLSLLMGLGCASEPKHAASSATEGATTALPSTTAEAPTPPSATVSASAAPRNPPSTLPDKWARDTGKEGAVVLRLDSEASFGVVLTCAIGGFPRNRAASVSLMKIPLFTMYEDGSVIFLRTNGERRVMRVQLDAVAARELLDEMLTLGIDKIDSRPRRCDLRQNPASCMSDASVSVIDVKLPGKKPRTIRNYAAVAQHQTELDGVLKRLGSFDSKDALDYLPTQAALVIEKCPAQDLEMDDSIRKQFLPWPFDAQMLWPPQSSSEFWARTVPAEPFYQGLYGEGARLGTTRGFVHKDRLYTAYVTPLLPGSDTKAVNDYHYP